MELVGSDIKNTQCLGLEMFRRSLDFAEVGENIGVLIRGIKKNEISRGYILSTPGIIKPYDKFGAKIYVLTKKEGGRHKGFAAIINLNFFFVQQMLQVL